MYLDTPTGETISLWLMRNGEAKLWSNDLQVITATKDTLLRASAHSNDLFSGPNLYSAYDSAILELRCHGRRRILDFTTSEIREE
jgi:hypothetical protein